jgi:hypothetical protein
VDDLLKNPEQLNYFVYHIAPEIISKILAERIMSRVGEIKSLIEKTMPEVPAEKKHLVKYFEMLV